MIVDVKGVAGVEEVAFGEATLRKKKIRMKAVESVSE